MLFVKKGKFMGYGLNTIRLGEETVAKWVATRQAVGPPSHKMDGPVQSVIGTKIASANSQN